MTTGLGRLFLRSGDTLEPLEEQHLSLEGTLQALLAEQPQLIPLQEIEPELTQPPLLLMREAKVAGMELDHLFVRSARFRSSSNASEERIVRRGGKSWRR